MKYTYTAFLLTLIFNTLHSQKLYQPVEIQLSFGIPIELPTVGIFNKNGFPTYNQIDFRIQKKVTNHVFLGLEYQYLKNNFNKEFILNFRQDFVESQTQITSKSYSIRKGLLNVGYALKNKKENLEYAAVLGIGIQSAEVNNYPFNAFYDLFGSVYVEEKKYLNNVLQVNLESTYYFKKNIGINFGIKTQYISINDPIIFSGIFDQNDRGDIPTVKERKSIKENYFTLIPSLGIRYSFNKK